MLSRHRPGRRSCASSASSRRSTCRGVGENLQDHPFNTVVCEVTEGSLVDAEHPRYLAEWLLRRSGPLTSTRRRGVRVRAQPPGPARARPPVPLRARVLRRPRRGEFEGHALTLGPGAAHAAQPRALGCARPTRAPSRGSSPTRWPSPEDVARDGRPACGSRARSSRPSRCARSFRRELFPGAGSRRRGPRGRPAPPDRAALPPRRHVPDGDRTTSRGRRAAARARRRGPARGRRLDHAGDHRRQHQRAGDHDRRARRRPDPRARARDAGA